MSLQNHYRGAFETGSGRHTHHHVANLIGVTLYVVTLCPVHKKRFHFIKMMRGTGHFRNFIKYFPDQFRLEISDFHAHSKLQFRFLQ